MDVEEANSYEAVGITLVLNSTEKIDIISFYSPKGNCKQNDLDRIIANRSSLILGGDFNGHHHIWESRCSPNVSGNAIAQILDENPDLIFATPSDMNTGIDPRSGRPSTIDLTLLSSALAMRVDVKVGPY